MKIMTRAILLSVALVLTLVLSGCDGSAADSASSLPNASSSLSISSSSSLPIASSTHSEASSQISEVLQSSSSQSTSQQEQVSYVGKYYETTYANNAEKSHMLELLENSTFDLRVNLGVSISNITGSYIVDGASIKCIVEKVNFSGFAGDDVTELTFDIVDANQLIYRGVPVAYIEDGNAFNKNQY